MSERQSPTTDEEKAAGGPGVARRPWPAPKPEPGQRLGVRAAARHPGDGGSARLVKCLVPDCEVESQAGFNLRHKICTVHQRMESVMVDGIKQRFCQQCTKLHPIEMFSGSKRGCKARLERHNKRRQMRARLAKALGTKNDGEPSTAAANLSEKDVLDLVMKLQSETAGGLQQSNSVASGGNSEADRETRDESHQPSEDETIPSRKQQKTRNDSPSPRGHRAEALEMAPVPTDRSPPWRSHGGADVLHSVSSHSIRREAWAPLCRACGGYGCALCQSHMMHPSGATLYDSVPRGPRQDPAEVEERVFNISMKLMGATPEHLPYHLGREIRSWLQLAPASIRGFMRPGCVHLSMDITLRDDVDYRAALKNVPAGFAASVASGDPSLPWCTFPTRLWLPDKVLAAEAGCIVEETPREDHELELEQVLLYPPMAPGAPQRLLAIGKGIGRLASDLKVLCRTEEDGGWHTLRLDAGSCSEHHLVAELSPGMVPGRVWVEVVREGRGLQPAMSNAVSLQLVPQCSDAVASCHFLARDFSPTTHHRSAHSMASGRLMTAGV